jgi:hypothetical protein
MALVQLMYTSNLVQDEPAVLVAILETARRINTARGITGMLLHANESILQVLEGEEVEVVKTFQSIEFDPRHNDVYLLSQQGIAQRQFAFWSMGSRNLSQIDLDRSPTAAQMFSANKDEITVRVKPGAALAMLFLFAQGIEVSN